MTTEQPFDDEAVVIAIAQSLILTATLRATLGDVPETSRGHVVMKAFGIAVAELLETHLTNGGDARAIEDWIARVRSCIVPQQGDGHVH